MNKWRMSYFEWKHDVNGSMSTLIPHFFSGLNMFLKCFLNGEISIWASTRDFGAYCMCENASNNAHADLSGKVWSEPS